MVFLVGKGGGGSGFFGGDFIKRALPIHLTGKRFGIIGVCLFRIEPGLLVKSMVFDVKTKTVYVCIVSCTGCFCVFFVF